MPPIKKKEIPSRKCRRSDSWLGSQYTKFTGGDNDGIDVVCSTAE